MTLPRVVFWAFLAAAALIFNALLQMGGSRLPERDAPPAAASDPTSPPAAPGRELIVPVARIAPGALSDTWGQARSEGRSHEGVDIPAPLGAPVLAAADGRIVKFFDSERGGVTIYQFDAQERFVFYYAHLNARAQGLSEGDVVRQGDVIGYVGRSGNAPLAHLHFEIQRLTPERLWWRAEAMNPYPYLVSGEAPE